ncbi:UNVERIFIED_CONTAM: hypothetical protein FKN15_018560 [Acipenser sinensis]
MENTSPVFKPPVVKEYLTKGARFTKWDDDTAVTSPVTLKVDPKGYYLYWTHQNHDMEFLELSSIRDTRSGKYAKLPKLPKVRNVFNMDFPESHHLTKTLTIVSGPDMVNLTFHNFFASKENVSKDWADDILAIAYNPLTSNACRQTYLDKISVKAKPYMTKEDLTKFINEKQRDSRLNEALFPPLKPDQVKSLIEKYEPAASNKHRNFPMQLNMAMFEYNGRTGWLLKHDFLRRSDKTFDPYSDRIDSIVANTVSIKASISPQIYSGQFLSDKNAKTGVEVEVIGLPGDPKRKYKTKWSAAHNSINPVWNEEPFVFEKILMPEMAYLRICVHEEHGKFIGHRIIPVHALRSGFHHICLRSESNMPLDLPALFVYIEVKDYIPASFADFTDLLSNPTKEDKKGVKLAPVQKPPAETSNNNPPETPSTPGNKLDTAPPEAATAAPPAETPAETPAATPAAPQEPPKPSPEPTTATTEELKQHKNFVKISQKHEKQIKDLEKKYQKKGDDLVKKYSKMFAALQNQLKKKAGSLKKGDTPDSAPAPDPKVAELKEKLKTELTQLREEQYDLIKKKKEEHSAEQSVKLLETAKEKHASELKALKESVDRIKKELNTTFIQEVVQMTTAIREHIVDQQEKLEKKQAATLDEIKEKTDKHKQDVNTEFDEKMKALPKDVEEGVNSAVRPYFPDEVEKPKENGSQVEGLSNEVYTG